MPSRIEDYAVIGDTYTAALVGRDGSIDWLCMPRFDSPAGFAALLGDPEHGRWIVAPKAGPGRVSRSYRDGTLVLDTVFETGTGKVVLTDFMPRFDEDERIDVVRILRCESGEVAMRAELIVRFDYGRRVPWVRRHDGTVSAVAGPDAFHLWAGLEMEGGNRAVHADFTIKAGESVEMSLCWHPSHLPVPEPVDARDSLARTEEWWRAWSRRCTYEGPHKEMVRRSLITLKALTYSPTGGIVAAATTSLPEAIGGTRNWDYRFCWLRDATLTLYSLMKSGYADEAKAWREWLLRAVAGEPSQLQMVYGIGGEHHLPEEALDWLPGYEGSRPVRIGNAAGTQMQLDVYGEIMDALHVGRRLVFDLHRDFWGLQCRFLQDLEKRWHQPDEGLWEVRGGKRHFTHSNIMAWVAVDRMIKDSELYGLDAPVERWRALRDIIHHDVCTRGFDAGRNTFVQFYGGDTLDAALLMIPLVGFLPCSDERVQGTLAAIEDELMVDGLVMRYTADPEVDGMEGGEGAFLACSFWYADVLLLMGRRDEAQSVFDRVVGLANDVGLLSEEYDTGNKRMVGNFPQAFSHISLINTAHNLAEARGPAVERSEE